MFQKAELSLLKMREFRERENATEVLRSMHTTEQK